LCTDSSSQELGFYGGVNHNRYHDLDKYIISEYKSGNGFIAGLTLDRIRAIDNIRKDTFLVKFDLHYISYEGDVYLLSGGQSGSNTLSMHSRKNVLGLSFYPVNFRIYKGLTFSAGTVFLFLIKQELNGYRSNWSWSSNPPYINGSYDTLRRNEPVYNKLFNFGISLNLLYKINISERFLLIPSYGFYQGLTNEFKSAKTYVFSQRHTFQLGAARKF
jgi:hypothetical protein